MLETANPFDERGKAALDLDHWRAFLQCFGVEVGQDQARFRSLWQAELDQLPGFEMPRGSRLDAK